MDKVVIAGMGLEGGNVTIYGRRVDGVWSFWQEGSSMNLDENDDEVWRGWSTDPVPELSLALPGQWWKMCPTEVHPEFVSQLRGEYERRWAAEASRSTRSFLGLWMKALAGPSHEA
jgi:hypothetical protein